MQISWMKKTNAFWNLKISFVFSCKWETTRKRDYKSVMDNSHKLDRCRLTPSDCRQRVRPSTCTRTQLCSRRSHSQQPLNCISCQSKRHHLPSFSQRAPPLSVSITQSVYKKCHKKRIYRARRSREKYGWQYKWVLNRKAVLARL